MSILKTTSTISCTSTTTTSSTSSNMIVTDDNITTTTAIQEEETKTKTKSKTNSDNVVRVVRFHQFVKVKEALHWNDYTDEENEACWYASKEYNTIQNNVFMTLDLMELCSNSNSNSNSTYCMRGLENLSSSPSSPQGLKESTRIRRRNAVVAVLNEQDRQLYERALFLRDLERERHNNLPKQQQHQNPTLIADDNENEIESDIQEKMMMFIYDDIKIRNTSRHYTRISEDTAYHMGQSDAATAYAVPSSSTTPVVSRVDVTTTITTTNQNLFQSCSGTKKNWNFNTTTTTATTQVM